GPEPADADRFRGRGPRHAGRLLSEALLDGLEALARCGDGCQVSRHPGPGPGQGRWPVRKSPRVKRPMSDPRTAALAAEPSAPEAVAALDLAESALHADGPQGALRRLAEHLDAAGDYRALLDALLLRARHELGLPLIAAGPLAVLPEPVRTQYEEKYV